MPQKNIKKARKGASKARLGDQRSFLSQYPSWRPSKEFFNTDCRFGMAELIKQAMNA